MDSKNLSETKFMKKIGGIASKIILKQIELVDSKIQNKENLVEEEQDFYVKSVFQKAMNILNTYEQLEFIPVFVRRFPSQKYYNDNEINHPKYLQYHIENHFLKITTILDQSIILVSEIFRLGTPPKSTSLNQLKRNRFTKGSEPIKLLRDFEKEIQDIKTVRNLIIHRGEFSDSEIDEIGMCFFISKKLNNKQPFPEFYLEHKMREIVKNKDKFLIKNNKVIHKFLTKLFLLLDNEFKIKFEEMK